jgi:hypothetical protein
MEIAEDDVHVILASKEGLLLPAKMLFKVLAENIKKPIDIIFPLAMTRGP